LELRDGSLSAWPSGSLHDAELYRNLKPQQASRALNALRDIGVVERARQGRWYVIDPVLRRYLAERRVEPLSFLRTAFDVSERSDEASFGSGAITRDE
jgi:DNA-binding transcriptional ArsR family regulator